MTTLVPSETGERHRTEAKYFKITTDMSQDFLSVALFKSAVRVVALESIVMICASKSVLVGGESC